LYLFDVVDSNPNGDPDNAGKPRIDLDTGQGLVSDVSLKRKVRDSVALQAAQGLLDGDRNQIFIRHGVSLNEQLKEAQSAVADKGKGVDAAQAHMVRRYFDVRMFGAVMTTGGASAGKVTGPVTIGIGRSLDPVMPLDMAITRVASTQEEKRDNASQMGNKTVIPYGLYAARIHYQPPQDSQITEADLDTLWGALRMMFEWTRSAARPEITVRGLFVFTHDNPLGNAPAYKLFEAVQVAKKPGVDTPHGFDDYTIVEPPVDDLPDGITYVRLA
jgi:CRISPR-associated protein Csd2